MEDTNMQPKSFMSSKEIMRLARKFYKDNFKKLWLLYILGGLGGISYSHSSGSSNPTNSAPSANSNIFSIIPLWVWGLIGVLLMLVAIFLLISRIALLKSISDTHKGQFMGVKDSYKKGLAIFWSFILIVIMMGWSVLGAMVLLIIPGIILSVYLSFAIYELIDKQKKGFQALLGSWSLIRGYWWTVVGKSIMIGLRIFVRGLLYFLAILIPALLLIIPGIVFHIPALLIIGISLGALASLWLVFVFLSPLLVIAMFELYYNFCDIRESNKVVEEALDKKRKRKLVISMIIGIVASILIIVGILAAIILVNVTQYVEKAKNLNQVHHLEFDEERAPAETQQILDKIKEVQTAQNAGEDVKTISDWQMALENPYFKATELTGKYLVKATVIYDPTTYKPTVQLQFNDAGTQLLGDITARNIGKPLAIFLDGASIIDTNGDGKIDNQDLYAPTVTGEIIGGKAVITGDMSSSTANLIVSELNSGVN
jgi:hypothetical protein